MIVSQSKEVDIIIPVHVLDEPSLEYLRLCLNSIVSFTPRDMYTLTCVIDRGYSGTEEFIRGYTRDGLVDQILFNTSERGFTRTCNIGLEESQAEFSLLLNMDTVVSYGWLQGLVDCARRRKAGVVGCKLLDEYGRINHAGAYGVGFHYGMNEPNTAYFEERQVEWVTGACFLIARSLRDLIGNLPEFWPHWGSDREYCAGAARVGSETWYTPIEILHFTEKSKSAETDAWFASLPR